MPDMNVIDKTGDWVINRAQFRLVDPTHGEGKLIVLEPGVPTKVKKTEWMKGQEVVVDCPDPFTSDDPMPSIIVPVDNTLLPRDEATGKLDASAAPGIQGSPAEAAAKVSTETGTHQKAGKK